MKIVLNGKEREFNSDGNIIELLSDLNLSKDRVIIQVDNNIIPTKDLAEVSLKENSSIEIMAIVGGG